MLQALLRLQACYRGAPENAAWDDVYDRDERIAVVADVMHRKFSPGFRIEFSRPIACFKGNGCRQTVRG